MENPLVSIIVITYNSSKYVLETLESAYNQTYQNIELIVSDDCSTDNTVEICQKWIDKYKVRFARTKLIIVEKNTGIVPNVNRGYKAAKGKWIKGVSGDDVLFPNSIQEYVSFALATKCRICWGRTKPFGDDIDLVDIESYQNHQNKQCQKIDGGLKYQKREICRGLFLSGTGLFYTKELYDEIGGLPEEYPFADEWPFIAKVIFADNKIFLLNKYVYAYRLVQNSLSHNQKETFLDDRVFNNSKKYFYSEGLTLLLKRFDILYAWDGICNFKYMSLIQKHKSKRRIFKLILLLSPVRWISFIKGL
jgi:glycosyltransferase involved in cell wall biosynthesis